MTGYFITHRKHKVTTSFYIVNIWSKKGKNSLDTLYVIQAALPSIILLHTEVYICATSVTHLKLIIFFTLLQQSVNGYWDTLYTLQNYLLYNSVLIYFLFSHLKGVSVKHFRSNQFFVRK